MESPRLLKLEKYVGRIVRLNQQAFKNLIRQAKADADLENCFLVAAVSREMRQLVCYGANTRITVCTSEVALI